MMVCLNSFAKVVSLLHSSRDISFFYGNLHPQDSIPAAAPCRNKASHLLLLKIQ